MKPTRNRRFGLAAVALLAGWVLAGCGGRGEAEIPAVGPQEPVDGGTCVIGMFSDYDSLNEFVSTDASATECMENMLFVPLLRWSADIELEGALGRSWEISDDGRTVTMRLREDIRWHDGVPTTAEDVKFSFDRFRDPELAYADIGSFRHLEEVEVTGPFEVCFRFTRAYADQLADLRRIILPRHLLEDVPSVEMESAGFGRAPVGNGPFRFVRWKRDQEIVFEANPDFPDGRPHLDRVVFRVIPDQTALETSLRAGQLDVVERLRYEAVEGFRRDEAFRVHTTPQRGYHYIGWNTARPLFATTRARLAMTLAIDRQRILDALAFGQGKVTAHPVMSLSPYYAQDLEPHPYDPARARALLAAEGWADTDGDGWLDRDGQRFEFRLVTNLGNQLREDTLVMVQADLAKIGVSVIPEVREWTVFLDEIKAKRFDACHLSWQTDFVLDPYDIFHSGAIDGKYNMTSFSHPRVDELIEAGTMARSRTAAWPAWREFQEILHREQPYTILYELEDTVGFSARIRGVSMDVRGMLVGVRDWWIAPADRRYAG